MERLTSIFDAGKTWKQIQDKKCYASIYRKLQEYEDAEEQGLLLRLPCKVGDTVYHYCEEFGRILEYKVTSIYVSSFTSGGIDIVIIGGACEDDEVLDDFEESLLDFKKSYFLTEEEAEKTLADMGV